MKKLILLLTISLLVISCKNEVEPTAQNIIDKAILIAGGNKFNHFDMDFDFRKVHYKSIRNNGKFELQRIRKDSVNTIVDAVSNEGYKRLINNTVVAVPDSMVPRYTASVNSVHYFSVLPFGLNDAAVNKDYIGEISIKGNKYHKIKVTFDQDGGGEDFEDVFVYWVNTKTYKTDYIAYSYNEDDGLGLRFREAYNERIVEGIRVVDYNNYKPNDESVSVLDLDKMYEENEMKLLSKIELENVSVKLY
ncbi:deoxyribose-phosphate aldolase [Flavobacteriaceae bacterium AU392]|nr:deoxyribose-phosphate aldolase [Flavobacteriaceae bacterium]RKM86086.1 deoxyribose-phosphate aldolase [Flavobacteriaceae bacterium AU392]